MKAWKISDYISLVSGNRRRLQQVFFTLALLSLGLNFWYRISISQIGPNPILYLDVDPVYMLFMYLGIPQFISGWPAPYFDALLVFSCIASLLWPKYTAFPILFFLLHFIYFILYNTFSGHHYISIGLLIMSFPFVFASKIRFASIFTLCRFIFCFMMFSAACWKIVRGNLWHTSHTNMLLVAAYTDELIRNKHTAILDFIRWLIQHRSFSHAMWCILIALETIFLAGFVTFKWDKVLLLSYLLFFAGGWIIFNIYNYDNLLFLLTLAPVLKLITNNNKPSLMKI